MTTRTIELTDKERQIIGAALDCLVKQQGINVAGAAHAIAIKISDNAEGNALEKEGADQ